MLRIRLTRVGKKGQPSYRIVVAEHTAPIQGKFVEIVGHYNPSRTPKELEVDQDRILYWISVGAKPTDRVASLLKTLGMNNMDQYIGPRNKTRRKKKASPEDEGGGAQVSESPESNDAVSDAPADDTPAPEAPPAAPTPEPAEEPPASDDTPEVPAEEAATDTPDTPEPSDTPAPVETPDADQAPVDPPAEDEKPE